MPWHRCWRTLARDRARQGVVFEVGCGMSIGTAAGTPGLSSALSASSISVLASAVGGKAAGGFELGVAEMTSNP